MVKLEVSYQFTANKMVKTSISKRCKKHVPSKFTGWIGSGNKEKTLSSKVLHKTTHWANPRKLGSYMIALMLPTRPHFGSVQSFDVEVILNIPPKIEEGFYSYSLREREIAYSLIC